MTRYGLPYKGSKNKIAKWVVDALPRAAHFYDLFAGGCAVTHAALLSGKFGDFLANDVSDAPALFLDAISGRYRNENRWISREDFFKLKDKEPYIRYCWSFGNSGEDYLYSKEVEPWKKAVHHARVFGDFSLLRSFGIETEDASGAWISARHGECKEKYIAWYCREVMRSDADTERLRKSLSENITRGEDELRAYLLEGLRKAGKSRADVDRFLGTNGMAGHYFGKSQWEFPTRGAYLKLQGFLCLPTPYDEIYGLQALMQSLQRLESLQRLQSLESLQRLQSLQRLESLQRLQSLQSLESLERLAVTQGDYRAVRVEKDSVIYCDIPYRGTSGYISGKFDYGAFYDWCEEQDALVVVSEYDMPADRFVRVRSVKKRQLMSGTGTGAVRDEGLFVPRSQIALWREIAGRTDMEAQSHEAGGVLRVVGGHLEFDFGEVA